MLSLCVHHGSKRTDGKAVPITGLCAAAILTLAFPALRLADAGQPSAYDYKFRSIIDLAGLGVKANYIWTYRSKRPFGGINYSKRYSKAARNSEHSVMRGLGRHQNVVLIFAESLSSYRSRFFGGFSDETPLTDKIAENSLAFTSHHTNGNNTATATFGLFTGLPYINSVHQYDDPVYFRDNMIRDFRAAGYHTVAMYSSKNFARLDSIYQLAGFDETVDGTDPFYDRSLRLTFDSVPDRDLFGNALRHIKQREKRDTPFFIFIMTSTNHPPFRIPDSVEYYSAQRTMTYMDEEISRFISSLGKDGFFRNGLAVITGDHRAMLPVEQKEIDRYGEDAVSRVQLIITGAGITPGKIESDTSHASIRAMLEYLELDRAPVRPFQFNPFAQNNGSEDVIFQPYDPADEIMIKTGGRNYTYRLRGDESSFAGDRPESKKAEELEELIYFIREGIFREDRQEQK